MQPAGSLPHKQQLATCSYAEPDLSSPCPHPISQGSISILFSHPRVDFPSGHLPSGFSTKTLRVPLHSPVRATCPIHLIPLDLITRIIFGEYKTNVGNAVCWKKIHHHHNHLALLPYMSLGLLCYSPPQVSILSFPSPSFKPHLL